MDAKYFFAGLVASTLATAIITVTMCQFTTPQSPGIELNRSPKPTLMTKFINDWYLPKGIVMRSAELPYYTAADLENDEYRQSWYKASFDGTVTVTGTYEVIDAGLGAGHIALLILDDSEIEKIPHLNNPLDWGNKPENTNIIELSRKDRGAWEMYGTTRIENVTATLDNLQAQVEAKEGHLSGLEANVVNLEI